MLRRAVWCMVCTTHLSLVIVGSDVDESSSDDSDDSDVDSTSGPADRGASEMTKVADESLAHTDAKKRKKYGDLNVVELTF